MRQEVHEMSHVTEPCTDLARLFTSPVDKKSMKNCSLYSVDGGTSGLTSLGLARRPAWSGGYYPPYRETTRHKVSTSASASHSKRSPLPLRSMTSSRAISSIVSLITEQVKLSPLLSHPVDGNIDVD